MKTLCLISGGKDSCFNAMHCIANGHEIVALGNLYPQSNKQELDSFMYQTVGHDIINLYSEALDIPIYRQPITGSSLVIESEYKQTKGDEVEDLAQLILRVMADFPDLQAVGTGAILSSYQRIRIENICARFGLVSLAYLWMSNQSDLLSQMIEFEMDSVLIKVAAAGLDKQHLGKSIKEMAPILYSLESKYGVNVCGEGGEYETITLDCPLFKKKIEIIQSEICVHSNDIFAPVSYMIIKDAVLREKNVVDDSWKKRLLCKKLFQSHVPLIEHVDGYLPIRYQFKPIECNRIKCLVNYTDPFLSISTITPDLLGATTTTLSEDTQAVLNHIQNILNEHDMTFNDAVLIHVYVNDMTNFSILNRIYQNYFGFNPSTRITVGINQYASIAIDLLAYKSQPNNGLIKTNLHVQGVSYWAPGNIGQACQVADIMLLAGSIGLIPELMVLPNADSPISQFLMESQISLNNAVSIAKALEVDLTIDGMMCVCFVTDIKWIPTAKLQLQIIEEICHVFVVVNSLPRNALIEWHFVTASKKGYDAIYHTQNELDLLECDSVPKKLYSMRSWEKINVLGNTQISSFGFTKFVTVRCKFSSALLVDGSSIEQAEWENVLNCLVDELITSAMGHQLLNVKCYHVNSINSAIVQQCIINTLTKNNCEIPSISCIPVTAADENALFNAYAMCFALHCPPHKN